MRSPSVLASCLCASALVLVSASSASAQITDASKWAIDLGIGIEPSINGNVNSGAIGTLQGQATAVLPNSFADVYGTGVGFRFGAAYALNEASEVRGMFIYQSADADLVRLGDIGASSLYGQYSDYKSFALDVGYRRYVPTEVKNLRFYGEATVGLGFINRINVLFAAPESNAIFNDTDFYDRTAAFTLGVNTGVLFRVAEKVDLNAQIGLRHVSGLSKVDQFEGTGLADINNDTARLTFPIVVGVRIRLK